MDIRKLNEKLQQLLEMTLKDEPYFGMADSIQDAYIKLQEKKKGCYGVPEKLRILKYVTDEDIQLGYADQDLKDFKCELQYPIKLSWGESDKIQNGLFKGGHGTKHAQEGHSSFKEAISKLTEILKRNVAVLDKRQKHENYIIDTTKYRFAFGLKDGFAILITGMRK